jgi:hypothetical protein
MSLLSGDIGSPDSITSDTLDQLPEDVAAAIIAAQIKKQAIIDALTESVKKSRDEAIKYRKASGIEAEWQEDEEHYEGIDDANRGDSKMIKPNHPAGVLSSNRQKKSNRSTVFYNITRQYVDSAAASVSEMGNPTDDRNFSLKAKPAPEVENHMDNKAPVPDATDQSGQPVQATVADFAQQEVDKAQVKATAAEKRIDSWLIDCSWHAAQRKVIHDAAKAGTGILKGPFPVMAKHKKTTQGADGKTALVIEEEIVPASKRISAWKLYPAPDCGDDIHNGSYLFELDHVNGRQLRDMKDLPGYLTPQIDEVIKAGPKGSKTTYGGAEKAPEDDSKYEIWYCYKLLSRDEIYAMGVKGTLDESNEQDAKDLKRIEALESCPCIVTMANDTVIKANLNPMDSGEYPYDIIKWEDREGFWAGRGVSRIMRYAQKVVNAGIRNLMDNAGLSGGVQVGVKKGSIKPMGGEWKLSNVTFWELTDEDAKSINDCLSFHQIPSMQEELMKIIQFGQKMAEDVTGMPLLLQGQTGAAPDTVGGMQLLNKNATATRRMIARKVDGELTEPHIERYYEWVMMYGDETEKGDYTIDARGSQSLVERDIARQFSIQMVANAANPIYGIDPYKAMAATLRAEMIDPGTWQYTETEYEKKQEDAAKAGPQIPAVMAAQIRAASAEKIAQEQIAADQQVAQTRATGEVQAVQARTARDDDNMRQKLESDSNLAYKKLELEERIAMLNYSTKQNISLQDAKNQLATTGMKLQTEKDLAAAAGQMSQNMQATQSSIDSGQAVHNDNSQLQQQGHDLGMTHIQQDHEQQMELLKQKHAEEMQAAQHKHEKNVAALKPAVQVPGRAGNGQALSQMPKPKVPGSGKNRSKK